MNRPKKDGTEFETACVATFSAHDLRARRLALGGSKDEGDLEVYIGDIRCVVECRTRESMSVHAAYADARTKTTAPLLLAWRRMKPLTEGRRRRISAGTLWILDTPTLMRLLGRTEVPRNDLLGDMLAMQDIDRDSPTCTCTEPRWSAGRDPDCPVHGL